MSDKVSHNKFNWPSLGQAKAVAFLEKSLISGRLAQSYIFSGPADLGKSTLALAFARNLLVQDKNFSLQGEENSQRYNSDLYILERLEGKQQISVEQVRQFIKMLNFSSFLNSYKIGIIKDAESLSPEAQSAFLKTLEEPKDKVIIILVTAELAALPATIASRAQIVQFYPTSQEFIYDYLTSQGKVSRLEAKTLAALAQGRPLRAQNFLNNPETYQAKIQRATLLLDFLVTNLFTRRQLLEDYLKNLPRQADVVAAQTLVADWQILWRDLIITFLGRADLVHYQALKDRLLTLSQNTEESNIDLSYLLQIKNHLMLAAKYLRANVNPKNTLLNIAFQL